VSNATSYLVAPGKPDDSISNGFANPLDAFNYLSPSAWINDAIANLTGVDVFGWCTDWLTGDWEAIWKFGDAMINLAECLQDLGIDIQHGAIDLGGSWDGNAADAAYQYFSNLAAATSGQQIALREIGENYHKAALGAWQMSNQLGNILQALADKAVIAGIAWAAGTATAETGIGAIAGYGVAAWQVIDMLELVNKASTIINTGGSVILGIFGGGMDLGYKGGDLSAVPLPATGYTTPGA
jgi:hypothetical protein